MNRNSGHPATAGAGHVIVIGRIIRSLRWSAPALIALLTPLALLPGPVGNAAGTALRSCFANWTGPVAIILSIVAFSSLGTLIIRSGQRHIRTGDHDTPTPSSV